MKVLDSSVNLAHSYIHISEEQASLIAKTLGQGRKKPIPLAPDWATMLSLADKYPSDYARFAYKYLLISGQRVTEALNTKRGDIALKTIDGKEFLYITSITLKNRNRPVRTIPIPLFGPDGETARELWTMIQGMSPQDPILGHINRDALTHRLAKVSLGVKAIKPANKLQGTLQQTINETIKIYPHFLRHARATELATRDEGIHKMDLKALMDYFGWASPTMPNLYITLNPKNLARAVGQV